jgi:transposase InsO family protein
LQARAYKPTDVPPLPKLRVSDAPPFSVTCVDYTGALLVKDNSTMIKTYICLFTCAITRAVHLELVENLTAEAFIAALQRFSGRRSYPNVIMSDNASNFTNSSKMISEILHSNVVNNYFLDHKIEWKFITPGAPWQGGVWERMVGVTKLCLKKLVGNSSLSFHELRTIIVQIEGAINDRPLTYASDTPGELEVLTPSMLLCGRRIFNMPESVDYDELFDPTYNAKIVVTKRMIYISKLMKDFLNRWQREYLTALRERERDLLRDNSLNVKIGQLVVIYDECPRQFWKMGLIVKLHKGQDGKIRSVDVKTKNGVFTRPLLKLYPLELEQVCNESNVEIDKPVVDHSRPIRKAAQKAASKIKQCLT